MCGVGSDRSLLQTSLGAQGAAGAGLDTLHEGTGAIFVEEVVMVFGNHKTCAPALYWPSEQEFYSREILFSPGLLRSPALCLWFGFSTGRRSQRIHFTTNLSLG